MSKSQKSKLIKSDVCLAILGEFGVAQNHEYHEFIVQKFKKASNGQLDLSGIIDWLMKYHNQDDEDSNMGELIDPRKVKI